MFRRRLAVEIWLGGVVPFLTFNLVRHQAVISGGPDMKYPGMTSPLIYSALVRLHRAGALAKAAGKYPAHGFLLAVVMLFCFSPGLRAQNLELTGGYSHSTGDFGLDGFQAGAGWFFTPNVSLNAQYDSVWDTSRIGTFEFTSVGAIAAKSHLQNFLFGPRIFFHTRNVDKHPIRPFAEAQFGLTHLNSTIQEGAVTPLSGSDTAFTWALGGGAEYSFAPHWTARGQLDLVRTHLNDQGQSRLRVGLGVAYSFGGR